MSLRRVVYGAQLLVPFLLPWLLFLGPVWAGVPAGWLSSFGLIMLGPVLTIALCVPVLMSLRDRVAYRARAGSGPYTVATLVCWGALAIAALFITEDTSSPPASIVAVWTGAAIGSVVSQYLFFLAIAAAAVSWAGACWFAGRGWFRSREAQDG